MKIWHISDTHSQHGQLQIPDGIDLVVHSGDATNWSDPYRNEIDQEIVIDGLKFWGTPWTPRYGNWSWMVDRGKINRKWDGIPDDTDVLICHGPPYGVLDATYAQNNKVELVGCSALAKRVTKVEPQLMLFGHVHSTKDIRNAGIRTISDYSTRFSNGSCCDDGKMGVVTSSGNILDIAGVNQEAVGR